jgi:hypothetical protein
MQTIIDFNLEHVVLSLEDVGKKIMDVEDGYTLQCNVKTSNGYANIQMNEDALLLQGIMLFDIFHTPKNSVQTTVKIYRDKKSSILCCEITGDNGLANLVLTEILQRYYAIQK